MPHLSALLSLITIQFEIPKGTLLVSLSEKECTKLCYVVMLSITVDVRYLDYIPVISTFYLNLSVSFLTYFGRSPWAFQPPVGNYPLSFYYFITLSRSFQYFFEIDSKCFFFNLKSGWKMIFQTFKFFYNRKYNSYGSCSLCVTNT